MKMPYTRIQVTTLRDGEVTYAPMFKHSYFSKENNYFPFPYEWQYILDHHEMGYETELEEYSLEWAKEVIDKYLAMKEHYYQRFVSKIKFIKYP